MSDLTLKQEKFCQEYSVNGGNATKAYHAAFNTKKMKKKSVNEVASRLLKDIKIASRIAALQKPLTEKYEVTREYLSGKLIKVINESEEIESGKTMRDRDCLIKATMELSKLHGLNVEKNPLSLGININADTVIDKGSSVLRDLLKNAAKQLEPQK